MAYELDKDMIRRYRFGLEVASTDWRIEVRCWRDGWVAVDAETTQEWGHVWRHDEIIIRDGAEPTFAEISDEIEAVMERAFDAWMESQMEGSY